ncbi:non-ribosomal peptide synthetase [Streptomyces niveus]|uniref:non-ribosomal peptide synthetase n=1 Tax=Streptomyces niveus TaxID=193462 RepID=UPI0033D345B0
MGRVDSTWPELVSSRARQTPNSIAVVDGDAEITYAELSGAAHELADRLRAAGVGPGDTVAIAVEYGHRLPVGVLAVLRARGTVLLIDPALPSAMITTRLTEASVAVLVTDAVTGPRLGEAVAAAGDRRPLVLEWSGRRTDGGETGSVAGGEAGGEAGTSSGEPADPPRPLPGDPAYLVFTSGSTGRPNAVLVSHGAFAAMVSAHGTVLMESAAAGCERFALNNPASADAVYSDLVALAHGGTLVVAPPPVRRDPEALAGWIAATGVEVLDATPTQIAALLADGREAVLEGLRLLVLGGEAVPPALWTRLRELTGTRVLNMYGPTECTVDVMCADLSESGPEPVIGRPLPGSTLRILGADLREVAPGTPGQIAVSGPQLADGYLNNERLTAERFVTLPSDGGGTGAADAAGERAYLTGDRGVREPDGVVRFLGRIDNQVQIGGNRVELGEVEAALGSAPRVGQCCVVALTEDDGTATLHAAVVLTGGGTGDDGGAGAGADGTAALVAALSATLAPHMVPRLHVWPSLPRAATGKTDTTAVRGRILASRQDAAGAGPERESVEQSVARFWRELLGVETVAPEDDFFAIGGNSLRAVKFVLRVRRELGVEFPMTRFFAGSTLGGCARAIDAMRKETADA